MEVGVIGKIKGEVRISRRLVDMSETQPTEVVEWRYEEEEHDEENSFEVPLSEFDAVMVRQVYRQGRLVDFGITQLHRQGGKWRWVARADSCHETVHVHRYSQSGAPYEPVGENLVLCDIFSQKDLENGYDIADATIEEQWKLNLRRWADG